MSTTAAQITDLSPEAVALLRAGAADNLGLCCSPGKIQENWTFLREAERAGYIRFLGMERPWITPEGRKAIGAPSEIEQGMAMLALLCANARKPLVPAKRNDPRTDFDYRSYRSMNYVCTLLVKQTDYRDRPATVRVGKTLTSNPQFLGPKNSIIQPESDGRFVLALVPRWLIRVAGFSTAPLPLNEADTAFSPAEHEAWNHLRRVCASVNSRIRNASRGQRQNLRFGEFA